jgi:AcrR family transcriptional regulator
MRVAIDVGERVVLAMDRHPLAWANTRGDPDNEAKSERSDWRQTERAVRHCPVEVNRGRHIRDDRDGQTHQDRDKNDSESGLGRKRGWQHIENRKHDATLTTYRPVGRTLVSLPSVANKPMRDQILDEATELFARQGYDGTSLNDIAAGVGIKRPSLLHHFPSKDALYGEVFEKMLSEWLERVEETISTPGSGWERFSAVLTSGFDLFVDNPSYVRLMRREALEGGDRLGIDLIGVVTPLFDAAVDWLEEEMSAGRFRSVDARHILITAYASLLGYVSDAPFINGLMNDDALAPATLAARRKHVLDLFHRALVPEGVTPTSRLTSLRS